MNAESNVRKAISADLAFHRWRAEHAVDIAGNLWTPSREVDAREVFRAGYEAAIRDLAQAAMQPGGPA